jgi:hypothetical protein
MLISGQSHSADFDAAIRSTISALAEIDSWYECEKKDLYSYPEGMRVRLMDELQKRHLRNREPYVRYLVQIYRMMVSERLFGSAEPLPQRKHQNLTVH